MSKYDLIIIGGGGFGSSAAYYAARQGKKVLVLEQFERGHNKGSSHGETRVIRKAYYQHPDYVPLLQQAYKLWDKLEQASQRDLIVPCGLMLNGTPESDLIAGTRQAAIDNGLDLEEVPEEEYEDRFPGFQFAENTETIYEVDGGFLNVESCVETYVAGAEARGVEFRWNHEVTHWESDGQSAKVWTKDETFEADALIITAGAWASRLLSSLPQAPQLSVVRKVMYWFPVRSDAYDYTYGSSCFGYQTPTGFFYGFPSIDGTVVKVCEHTGGTPVEDPSQLDKENHEADLAPVLQFLQDAMPEVDPHPVTFSVCMYTMTPDEHFIVDQHPDYQNVCFGAGFSGHGFKFVSILGKVLADLAIHYETDQAIQFLSLNRFTE
ncbi:MAG: N-methyl-L-tryptophan oxidase [Planctomicrobium sp.]|jgi:sarcosine oxidase|nr:N-methyl-L-tryptophan oxidase [Planctomicrobium sp.]